jgi:hypothetical protein
MPGFDRRVLVTLLREAAELPASQKIEPIEKRFGNLSADARIRAEEDFARTVVESKNFASAEAAEKCIWPVSGGLRATHDPMIDFAAK